MRKLTNNENLAFPIIIKLHWLDYALLLLLTVSLGFVIMVSIVYPTSRMNEAPILLKWVMLFFAILLTIIFMKILLSDKTFLIINAEKLVIKDAFTQKQVEYKWSEIENIEFSFSRYSSMNLTFKNAKPLENGKSIFLGSGKCLNGKSINARELADIIIQAKNSLPQKAIEFHSTKMKFFDSNY